MSRMPMQKVRVEILMRLLMAGIEALRIEGLAEGSKILRPLGLWQETNQKSKSILVMAGASLSICLIQSGLDNSNGAAAMCLIN